jgi:tetratricopeptide (TPR) repeat protein
MLKTASFFIVFSLGFCSYAKAADSCAVLLTRAGVLMQAYDYAAVITTLDSCLKNDPNHAAANNLKGCAAIRLTTINDEKNVRLAIACFSKAILLEPANYVYYNNRGWAYGNLDENIKASADFNKAIQLDSSLLVLQMNVLRMLYVRNRNKEAYAYCDRLIRMFPDDGYAYYVRGNLKRDYLHKYPEGNKDIKLGEELGWRQGMYLMY